MHTGAVTFEAMYQQEFDYVARSLRRLGAEPHEVKDLCHDVFLVAFQKLPTYDRHRPLRPWLFGIAFRAVSDSRGRAYRRREVTDVEVTAMPGGVDPHAQAEASQARRAVLAALQQVAPARRAVFVLHDLDGASAPDIAEALGTPLNTVYSRLRVARAEVTRALRSRLLEGGAS